jgi:hypothetical protein
MQTGKEVITVNRSWTVLFAAILVTSAVVTVAAVTCESSTTPLYTFRMEQASNKMNFLPTPVNTITYSAMGGSILNYAGSGCCTAAPLGTAETCEGCSTIEITCYMCPDTWWSTCGDTCPNTCWNTCTYTCWSTCPSTCGSTCPNTCYNTCPNTCYNTCEYTCEYTCEGCSTIEITCYTCPYNC